MRTSVRRIRSIFRGIVAQWAGMPAEPLHLSESAMMHRCAHVGFLKFICCSYNVPELYNRTENVLSAFSLALSSFALKSLRLIIEDPNLIRIEADVAVVRSFPVFSCPLELRPPSTDHTYLN